MDANSCFILTQDLHTVVYYSHIVPMLFALFLAIFALFRTKASTLAVVFFLFTLSFSLWLLGDMLTWVSQNYHIIYFTWSWLDFLDITFFVLGAFFFALVARGKIALWEKIVLAALMVPPLVITATGHSVLEFNQPICEASENSWLATYKFAAEAVAVALMLWSFFLGWRKSDKGKRIQFSVIFLALILFFSVFSGTAYISSITTIYEITLYGLFVLPLFLIILTFAITDLHLFQFRFVGTQVLAYVLILMTGSQLLFIEDSSNRVLTLVTIGVSVIIGFLLIENAKREAQARVRIEGLAKELALANDRLKELDQLKSEFLSIASHQLRAPITAVRGYASNIVEGEYGPVPDNLKEPLATVQETARMMVNSIEDYLNISRIEQGRMKYEKSDFDIADMAKKVVEELGPLAIKKKLSLDTSIPENLMVNADIGKIKQVATNLLDNAIKYTEQGSVTVKVEKIGTNARVTIQDTGVGLSPEDIGGLFEKFKRARGANKVNTTGTGLGLYVAKQLVEGNGGKIWVESDGQGKGSRFIFELPALS